MRAAFVGLTLVLLFVLVAAGSAGGDWTGGSGERDVPSGLTDAAYTLLIVAIVAIGIAYLMLRVGVAAIASTAGPSSMFSLIVVWAAAIAFALLAYRAYEGAGNPLAQLAEQSQNESLGRTPGDRTADSAATRREPQFQWWLAWSLASLALTVLVVLHARRRRARKTPSTAAGDLEAVLAEALEEVELDPDPRRAVIQAYVRMEAVLAAHGHGRAPHEAPLEYLARVLRGLDVRAEAAHALTELFERARFSHHEIDAAMRAEAVASLEAVRDDLRAAA